jgi:hypothetical protein
VDKEMITNWRGVLLLNLSLAAGFIALFNALPIPAPQLCIHPLAKTILMALGLTLIINIPALVVWRKTWLKASPLSLYVIMIVGVVVVWLGSYTYSPLGYSNGIYPILQGFRVTRQGRINEPIASGKVILLRNGALVGISVSADLPNMTCHWTSLKHGALDDPDSCDIAYSPPTVDYDILTVRIGSGCRLQPVHGQIKIIILR